MRVPEHEGVKENERADEAAKIGSPMPLNGPEVAVGIASRQVETEIRKWLMDQHHTSTGMRRTKAFILGPSRRLEERLLKLEKRDLKLVGHCRLRRHLGILGTGESGTCRNCEEEEETPLHVLCHSCALAEQKF